MTSLTDRPTGVAMARDGISGSFAGSLAARARKGRFTILGIIIVTLFLSAGAIRDEQTRQWVAHISFSALLLFTMWAVDRHLRLVTSLLTIPALASLWVLHLAPSPITQMVGFTLTIVSLAFLTILVIIAVLRDAAVTADTIVGALCAYLLLGMTWGGMYAFLALVSPNAFTIASTLTQGVSGISPTSPLMPLMQYFSFVTLSTVGYGDITPVDPTARGLAVMESMVGQLYVAVLVARLVGIHTAGAHKT